MNKLFITATDTDAGKTHIASIIIHSLVKQGYKVAAFKPISAGCQVIDQQLVNDDALMLQQLANCDQTITQVNPIAFEQPIAPHIAAQLTQQTINLSTITENYQDIIERQPDIIMTEGAGGWRLPLGGGKYLSEFAQQTQQQVVLVVNMKLGCLNHAILTYQAIINDGLFCVGWIANCQQDMPYLTENIAELTSLIDAPLLGKIPYEKSIEKAAQYIQLTPLIG